MKKGVVISHNSFLISNQLTFPATAVTNRNSLVLREREGGHK